MKKQKLILVVMMIIVMVVFGLVACGASLTGIELKSGSLESTVTQGDTFDTSTAIVYATYSNNSQEEITASDLTFSDVNTSAVGTVQLTISYEEFSIVHNITVQEKAAELGETVISLTVQEGTIPNKVAVGGTLDLSGAIVVATMDDGVTKTLTSSDLTFTTISTATAGTQTLRISYGGKTIAYSVEVVAGGTGLEDIATLAVEAGSVANIVQYDGSLDLSELVLIATYGNGTIVNITAGYIITGLDVNQVGVQTITFTYGDISVDFTVTVTADASQKAAIATAIELSTAPASVVNRLAELDLSAVVARVTFMDGMASSFSYSDLTITEADTDTIGTKSITISYTDIYDNVVSCTHTYEVVALLSETAASITVTSGTLANKVAQNDTLDTTNADIKVVYADGSSSAQTVTVTLDSSILGAATAVLSFTDVNGKVVTLNWDVTIVDAATDLTAVESIA
ncbi:MAG: bacterial Ig-like domain-containing protein, partial [Bacillota bacterium]